MKLPSTLTPIHWVVAVIVILLLVGVGYYNSFVTQTNAIAGQWKQVEVQYQRRVDLIPNLIESVKGLQRQEQRIFGEVNEARQNYAGASNAEARVRAANQLEGALSRLVAVFENYPQIKSDAAVVRLMDELAGTENRVAVERRRYNEIVQNYNISVSTLPGKFFASVTGFQTKTYFQAALGSEDVPAVQLP